MVYVALLRGINVGGKNLIKMTELAALFEALGLTQVRTYIQSGNVVFSSEAADKASLTTQIEETLSCTFHYDARVVLQSHEELKAVVMEAPEGFGSEPDTYRYDVFFLKEPLTSSEAMKSVTTSMATKEGVDRVWAGLGVLYTSRLIIRASQSRLTRLIGLPVYQSITIRNWNTTTRLLKMMEKIGD